MSQTLIDSQNNSKVIIPFGHVHFRYSIKVENVFEPDSYGIDYEENLPELNRVEIWNSGEMRDGSIPITEPGNYLTPGVGNLYINPITAIRSYHTEEFKIQHFLENKMPLLSILSQDGGEHLGVNVDYSIGWTPKGETTFNAFIVNSFYNDNEVNIKDNNDGYIHVTLIIHNSWYF